jgi:hypothetical protein
VATDDSLPVGTVAFDPGSREVGIRVILTDAAPEWEYYVEVWTDEGCQTEQPLRGDQSETPTFRTDEEGAGELDFVLSGIEPGTYRLNVDVVSSIDEPEDPRHGEIAASSFTEIVVDE